MSVRVRPLDAHDDAQWAAFYAATQESLFHQRPYADMGSVKTHRVSFNRPAVDRRTTAWAAWDGDDVVATAVVGRPLLDNLHLATLDLMVRPDARRQGIGSAVLAVVESDVAASGRRILLAELARPIDAESDAMPGPAFAAARGYARAHAETHFVAELPPPAGLLDEIDTYAAERLPPYRVLSWLDPTPDEWLEPYCALEQAFNELAPTGDIEVEPERWNPERIRDGEERRAARHQVAFTTVAVAPDGTMAGNTQLMLNNQAVRGGAGQSGTLVLPDHRGHRLGLAMKVANVRRLLEHDSSPRLVHTWNAGVNAPMLAVNARLGFRAVELEEEWQRTL